MALVTAALIKEEIDMKASNTSDDTLLGNIATGVNSTIDAWTDRVLDNASYTHVFNGSGTHYLLAKEWPVTTLTTVKIASGWDFTSATAEDSDDLAIDDMNTRKLVHRLGWPRGVRNIQVAYTAGYTTFPDDLIRLGRYVGAQVYRSVKAKAQNLQSVTEAQGASYSFRNNLPDEYKDIVNHYRRKGIAGG